MTRISSFLLFLSGFLLITSSFSANAQILVAPSFLSGDGFAIGVADFINAGETGENMMWDYSAFVTQDSYNTLILPSSPSPYEDDYPDANWIMEVAELSQSIYINFGPEFFEFFGGVEQGASYPLTDSDIFWPYPFEYGETWNDSMSGTLDAQGIIINRTGTTESILNGYGSISLPGGIHLDDVTRVELNREIIDSSFVGVDIYKINQTRFFHGSLLAPLVVHTNFQIISELDTTVIDYTELLQSYTVGLALIEQPKEEFGLFPNPASNNVQVVWSSFGTSPNKIEIRDITGRVIKEFNTIFGMSATTFDVSSWASGVYTVTVNPGQENSATKKLIVE